MNKSLLLGGLLALAASTASAQVVISQVYGGGGNSGAPFTNDFVEVFNRGTAPVDLTGWSVQYASATGTGNFGANPVVALSGALAPGRYLLVGLSGGATGAPLPAADVSGTIAAAAGAGKFALVSSGGGLACNGGSTPCVAADLARIADLVGYGGANFFEGAPAPALSNTTAALRSAGGCTDANNNATDFSAAAPAPRNASTAANVCSAPVNAPIVTSCPALSLAEGAGGSVGIGASDADGTVRDVIFASAPPTGITLADLTPATGPGGGAGARVVVAPQTAIGSYPLSLRWSNDQAQTANCTVLVNVAALTRIPQIQGRGATSPLAGLNVTTEGVVTHVINNGYFLQDPVGDGDPLTSDGLFVFNGSATKPLVGQRVRVNGSVVEFNTGSATNLVTSANPLTELSNVSAFTVLPGGAAVAPTVLNLPTDDFERYEGMLVTIPGPVTVTQNFFLGRYGQMTMAVGGRLENPTNRLPPGPEAQALAADNARRSFLLDDSTSLQNPSPIPYIGADNTVRAGDTTASLTGVLDYGLATASTAGIASYRLQPTVAPAFARANPRTQAPEPVGGNLKVASFNVLNFFTTFTDGRTADGQSGQGCALGDSVAASNCRGANNGAEFGRQRAKIVEAMAAIDADVLGLIEIQNNGLVAAQNLVEALNARVGAGRYAVVPDPATGTGTDAIKLALIYQPARVSLVGGALSDTDPVHNRPPLAQSFAAPNGERFSVVVNHFKSKGCDGATGPDLDQGDLQSCFNEQRVQQAQALASFIEGVQALAGDEDVLVIGDLNAYAKEDPITELTGAGFVDEIGRYNAFGYSFTFDGTAGRLDHALTTPSLSTQVTGATEWHINTDEPSVIDYNTEFKPQDCYSPTAYRSSDHDPVVVGLNLVKTIAGSRRPEKLVGTPGDDRIEGGRGPDWLSGNGGRDVFVYNRPKNGVDLITDFRPADDRLDLRGLVVRGPRGSREPVGADDIRVLQSAVGALVQVAERETRAPRGKSGKSHHQHAERKRYRTLAILLGVKAAQFDPARDIAY